MVNVEGDFQEEVLGEMLGVVEEVQHLGVVGVGDLALVDVGEVLVVRVVGAEQLFERTHHHVHQFGYLVLCLDGPHDWLVEAFDKGQ